MQRITLKDLQKLVDRINTIKGVPLKPWEDKDGKFAANIGNYHLDGAYGGYALHQMMTTGGGIKDILTGHMTKRDLYNRMQAFICGCEK
jgi:hypothetical protein